MNQRSIHRKCCLWLGGALLALVGEAHATVFCSVSSVGFHSVYVPSNPTTNATASSFTVTCSRDNAPGPANSTVKYQLAADNGLHPSGTQNRAVMAGNFINYYVATDPCTTPWKGTSLWPTPEASFLLAKNSIDTRTHTFYGCVPAGQAVLPPEGIYIDTVTMSFAVGTATGSGNDIFSPGIFPVSIIAPASCTFTTPPSNIEFTYAAFSPSDVLANSTFGLRCSTFLPYTMTLDATVDVVAGLNYSLALNTTGSGGTNPLTSLGTGSAQTFYINGRIAAGQAGSCTGATCTESQVRTLMISY